jgi:hypothetical protein
LHNPPLLSAFRALVITLIVGVENWAQWLMPEILPTPEAEIRSIAFPGLAHFLASLSKMFLRPHLNQQLDAVVHTVIPATQGSTNRRIAVQATPGIKQDHTSKATNEKRLAE